MNPKWCRAGRALLNWSQAELAAKAGIGLGTLQNVESGYTTTTNQTNIAAIKRGLESGGLIFRADGIDSADAVLERYSQLKNPTREETAHAIVCAGIVRRAGGRRRMTDAKAAEMLRLGRERRGEE
jgi:DNA-binding XRE family transcriptional regulator